MNLARVMAKHAGISGQQAVNLLNTAIKSSHRNAFKMFSASELGPVKLSTEVFIGKDPAIFQPHGIHIQVPSKAVLQFDVEARPQEITFFGLTPDLPNWQGKYGYETQELESGLVILCGTLGGNPKVPLPPPPTPAKGK